MDVVLTFGGCTDFLCYTSLPTHVFEFVHNGQLAARAREVPKSIVTEALWKTLGPIELTDAPDQKPVGP